MDTMVSHGKRLGQHFLHNPSVLKKIVAALDLAGGDVVIEIGPGHGELTEEIKNQIAKIKDVKIITIEKDSALAQKLEARNENIEVITSDALRILPTLISHFSSLISYKLVGNIPYYITGKLLRVIGELTRKPERCVFTVQKEVAERTVAQPPRTNKLSASVQFWAEPKVIALIPRTDFRPAPNVDSAIITLEPRKEELGIRSDEYYKAVRILFAQPRKTVGNNLRENSQWRMANRDEIDKTLSRIGVNPNDRPQDLSIEQIVRITGALKSLSSNS